jgi:hypothetical protein
MSDLLSKERIIAPAGYNRWRVPLASIAIHLCIGSVYAWSIYNPSLTKVHGVVTSSAEDAGQGDRLCRRSRGYPADSGSSCRERTCQTGSPATW